MRHGEVLYFNARGGLVDPRSVTLTDAGKSQACAAAEMLACYPFSRALCSTAPRTQETAAAVLQGRETALEAVHDLREIRGGRFAAIPPEDVGRVIGRAFDRAAHDEERFIGGERFADFEARVLPAFARWLLSAPGDEVLLAVLHEGVNRLLLSWVLTDSRAAVAGLEQDPCCVNVIDFDIADGVILRKLVRMINVTPADLPKKTRSATGMEELCESYRSGLL
jgi:phosphoserine phosphatase